MSPVIKEEKVMPSIEDKKYMDKLIKSNKDLCEAKFNSMESKMSNMVKRVRKLEETGQYVVKVADSCPLAIEQQR